MHLNSYVEVVFLLLEVYFESLRSVFGTPCLYVEQELPLAASNPGIGFDVPCTLATIECPVFASEQF